MTRRSATLVTDQVILGTAITVLLTMISVFQSYSKTHLGVNLGVILGQKCVVFRLR